MNLETKKSLYDVLQAALEIEKYTNTFTFDDFQDKEIVQAAVERKFEIIGEALNRINRFEPDFLQQIPDYQRIIGFRNVIAHGYNVVDVEIVWEAITDYLPGLVNKVKKLLDEN